MIANSTAYSAEVDMFLLLRDQKVPLGQLGPSYCIVEQPINLPPQDGEIVLTIDGSESRLSVHLPNGISPDQARIAYQVITKANGADHP